MTNPRTLTAAFLAAATLLAPTAPNAQPRPDCAPTDLIADRLATTYGELPTAIALQSNGTLLKLYTSPNGETWTIVIEHPDGMSCPASAGTDWTPLERTPPDTPANFTPIQAEGHPPPGALDPYAGYKDANGVSCCGGKDCAPAPYRDGRLQLPDGTWVDPRETPGASIYFSFDGRGHACVRIGRLRCAFIPGEGA
jgi:hypothetical protein